MAHPPVSIRSHGSEMFVVPAIHFCHTFASEVNRICSNSQTRPEAVAVELGPIAAAATRQWIQELILRRGAAKPLPVMLALLRKNTMIRPSLQEKATRLQTKTGRDIAELEFEILHRELGFTSHSILFLSPVDSIIEAIRCSLELKVPVFGVDLEETAGAVSEHTVIPNPRTPGRDLAAYTMANTSLADATRDNEIAPRRETAMAARLKTIMSRYSKVLFTCGMAHWLNIERLLKDDSLKAAPTASNFAQELCLFRKTLVHPSIAVPYLDLFPSLAQAFEMRRIPAPGNRLKRKKLIDAGALFRARLRLSYKTYFAGPLGDALLEDRALDLESISIFESYLLGMQRINCRSVPDLYLTLQAARETMSGVFADNLTENFMRISWAEPQEYPECAILTPPSIPGHASNHAMLDIGNGEPRRPVYLNSIPAFHPSYDRFPISYKWKAPCVTKSCLHRFTWRPWEYLATSMSFQAIRAGKKKLPASKTLVFEGSLLEGIEVKSTLRAFSRGKDHLYVRDRSFEEIPAVSRPMDGFPVVWILVPGEHPSAKWKVLHEPSDYMKKHIRDVKAFQENVDIRGDSMTAIIGYGNSRAADRLADDGESYSIDHYYGVLIFQPICWTDRQFAHWVETTRYERNPFLSSAGCDPFSERGLKVWYEQKYGLRLQDHDWATSMALMAMPFCADTLTVVMPQTCLLEPIAYERAQEQRIHLTTVPLDMFPVRQVSRLSECQIVPAVTIDPEIVYPKSIERAIGESQTKNRKLVPPEWLHFGNESSM